MFHSNSKQVIEAIIRENPSAPLIMLLSSWRLGQSAWRNRSLSCEGPTAGWQSVMAHAQSPLASLGPHQQAADPVPYQDAAPINTQACGHMALEWEEKETPEKDAQCVLPLLRRAIAGHEDCLSLRKQQWDPNEEWMIHEKENGVVGRSSPAWISHDCILYFPQQAAKTFRVGGTTYWQCQANSINQKKNLTK